MSRDPRYEEARRRWPTEPANTLAAELGIPPSTLSAWAHRGQWGTKRRGRRPRHDWPAIRAAFAAGATYGEVLARFGADPQTVRGQFRRYGWAVPPRCPNPQPGRVRRKTTRVHPSIHPPPRPLELRACEKDIKRGRCRKRCEAGHLWTPRSVSEPCPVCAAMPEPIGPIVARVMATIQGRRTA